MFIVTYSLSYANESNRSPMLRWTNNGVKQKHRIHNSQPTPIQQSPYPTERTTRSPQIPTLPLKPKVERHRHKQRGTQHARPQFIIVPRHAARADGPAAVQVDADSIAQRHDGEQRECAGGDKRRPVALLRAEVEQRHCDGADVDGVFELGLVS